MPVLKRLYRTLTSHLVVWGISKKNIYTLGDPHSGGLHSGGLHSGGLHSLEPPMWDLGTRTLRDPHSGGLHSLGPPIWDLGTHTLGDHTLGDYTYFPTYDL